MTGVPTVASATVSVSGSTVAPRRRRRAVYGLSSSGEVRRDSTSISQTPGMRVGVGTRRRACSRWWSRSCCSSSGVRGVLDRDAVRVDGDEPGLAAGRDAAEVDLSAFAPSGTVTKYDLVLLRSTEPDRGLVASGATRSSETTTVVGSRVVDALGRRVVDLEDRAVQAGGARLGRDLDGDRAGSAAA